MKQWSFCGRKIGYVIAGWALVGRWMFGLIGCAFGVGAVMDCCTLESWWEKNLRQSRPSHINRMIYKTHSSACVNYSKNAYRVTFWIVYIIFHVHNKFFYDRAFWISSMFCVCDGPPVITNAKNTKEAETAFTFNQDACASWIKISLFCNSLP
jgi:hypothetical protein